ncbi:monocarboxylate transporter 13-like [Acanthaster planci]|uniref:Monocarboxylate transporter 13-like n=1 Tax=Acanthaster planci TaxID=133434 RepID=A0A8B7XQ51_ACAPL|nr:monocarboxylate transporter 13-like [Acanthaster planci]
MAAGLAMLGRWTGWLVTFATMVQFFLLFGPLYNYSILFVSFREEFETSAALTGWLGSVANGLISFFSPVGGVLLRWLSHRTVCLLGVAVYSAGALATSFVPNIYWAFLSMGVMMSFGAGASMHCGICLLFQWYPGKNNARATCLALLGTSIGLLAFAPTKTQLIENYGWRNMLRILSGVVFTVGMLDGTLLMPASARQQRRPADGGSASAATGMRLLELQPRGEDTEQPQCVDKATDPFCDEADGEEGGDFLPSGKGKADSAECAEKDEDNVRNLERDKKGFAEIVRDWDAWLFVVCQTLAYMCWSFVVVNFASFMKSVGFSADDTSLVLVVFGVAEVAGKILTAFLGDHLPFLQVNALAITSVIGAIAAGFLTLAKSLADLIILSVVSGLMRSTYYGITFSSSFELFGVYGGDIVAALVMVPCGLGNLSAAPLTGALFDASGNYTLSLLVLVGLFALSTVCVLAITIRRKVMSPSTFEKRYRWGRKRQLEQDVKTEEKLPPTRETKNGVCMVTET